MCFVFDQNGTSSKITRNPSRNLGETYDFDRNFLPFNILCATDIDIDASSVETVKGLESAHVYNLCVKKV